MTSIEWTQRPGTKGETWNPIAGCSIFSPGCTHCYAMRMAQRIQAMGGKGAETYAGTTKIVNGNPVWTGRINVAPDATLLKPLRWRDPRTVFVNSMSDLFHEDVPDEVIDRIFAIMALTPQHTYQVLTKRSARMRAYLTRRCGQPISPLEGEMSGRTEGGATELSVARPSAMAPGVPRSESQIVGFPPASQTARHPLPNVWLGVSAERQKEADERIPDLLATPAAVRFISAEPLLGPIDFYETSARWPRPLPADGHPWRNGPILQGIDWIIVGGESGPGARPMHPAWARSIRDQCAAAGTAFFFKQWGNWAPLDESPAADEAGWQGRGDWMILDKHGDLDIPDHRWPDEDLGEVAVISVGKARAGRLLDGAEHSAYPLPCVRGRGGSGEARDGEGA